LIHFYKRTTMFYVKTLTGKTLPLYLKPYSTVEDLKCEIEDKEGIPVAEQRLIFGGKKLENVQTLFDCNIQKGDVVHMVIRLRGMISNFSEFDVGDPLIAHLMSESNASLPEELLKDKRKKLQGSKTSGIKVEYTGSNLLNARARKQLMGVANYVHAMQQIEGKSEILLQDIKIVFPHGFADMITRTQVEDALRAHHHYSDPRSVKLVLRRTSPTSGCIPWHVDGIYSTSVVQYTLNDDSAYQGGRLWYYTEDVGLFCPFRPAGTITVHQKEMHAVSKLTSGVRYVLFVVDHCNGLGGEMANVVTLTKKEVDIVTARLITERKEEI